MNLYNIGLSFLYLIKLFIAIMYKFLLILFVDKLKSFSFLEPFYIILYILNMKIVIKKRECNKSRKLCLKIVYK